MGATRRERCSDDQFEVDFRWESIPVPEITVWPPEIAPETPTEESDESRLGVKYFGPGDKNCPTRVNHGRRRDVVKVGGLERILKAHVVPVRKPLLAVCDLLATGHDVHFTAEGSWVEHRKTGEVINFIRRGGKFEIDVEVQLPEPVGKRVGASFAVSAIEGAGVPPREGAQDALPEGEQLRQHQAAAGGGGVVPLLAPGMPTAAEKARHEVDHCPYQAWCRSCVAGRGKADAHFRRESEEEGVAYVATD